MKITKSQSSGINFWLLKAEPNSRIHKNKDVKFSIEDLKEIKISQWDGVRNYEARNIMRDKMKIGDLCFFYHSNCKVPGIAGICEVVKNGYVDYTAFDVNHPYYDDKSCIDNPKWFMVDVQYVRHLKRFIPLKELQSFKSTKLEHLALVNRGRLSVQPVSREDFDFILSLE